MTTKNRDVRTVSATAAGPSSSSSRWLPLSLVLATSST
eukprot:CAMPEP_0119275622 /NCGR_PEP_ID=MMETSP1329-20130426/14066_1 /TAXON_ID=114041 /ORGANISM="Genus nov. species nov., Strain RCC1024" /LENGTH=37 /DNA_ID= /DNA_START= /DNA_END= /DNA_ORIENTATION=